MKGMWLPLYATVLSTTIFSNTRVDESERIYVWCWLLLSKLHASMVVLLIKHCFRELQ